MTGFLLDSVILIDHFNGVTAATDYLRRNWTSASVSVITRAEVLTGFQAHREALGRQLLDRFPTHPAGADDADLAAASGGNTAGNCPMPCSPGDRRQSPFEIGDPKHQGLRSGSPFVCAHSL